MGTYGGAPFAQVAKQLGINDLDTRTVQLQDLALGPHIIDNPPTASNMVIVATPPESSCDREIDLEAVALAKECGHLNHRRFAAVKITYGTSPQLVSEREVGCCAALAERAKKRARGPGCGSSRPPQALRWLERCTVLLFRSQRWVCTGATHPDEAVMCTLRAAAEIRDIYPWFPNPVCAIQNIVASANLFPLLQPGAKGAAAAAAAAQLSAEDAGRLSGGGGLLEGDAPRQAAAALRGAAVAGARAGARVLPLRELVESFGLHGNYKPDLFPGGIIRLGGVCFLVFDSGACVITGAKCPRVMTRAYTDFFWTVSVHLLAIAARFPQHAHLKSVVPGWMRSLVAQQTKLGKASAPPPRQRIVY